MISIAMATYNGEKYLREQLDSILNQTINDWELIVCDDCSKDATWNILQEYAQKDVRIKIYRNEQNIGFVKNFEKAVSLCSGEYIAFSDQDDIWVKKHLDILYKNLNGGIASVGDAKIINEDGIETSDVLSERDLFFVKGSNSDFLFRILFYQGPFQGSSSLYHKSIFTSTLPIPLGIGSHDVWFSAAACCFEKLHYTTEIVNQYRIHGHNTSGNHKLDFFTQVKTTLKRKGWKTDRIAMCAALLSRIPNMSEEKKNIILMAKEFHENRIKGNRLKTIRVVLKFYKKIYSTNNYKQAFARCIGILLRG